MAATKKAGSSRLDKIDFSAAISETIKPEHDLKPAKNGDTASENKRAEIKTNTGDPKTSNKPPESGSTRNVKKAGRPSNGEVKHISLAIPVDIFEKTGVAALLYDGNRTKYINALIKKDLEENYDKYSALKKLKDSI